LTLKEIDDVKNQGNQYYGKNEHSQAVHYYKNSLQLIGTLNISQLFEIMTSERSLEFYKINLIINSNLCQAFIKVKEAYQALHYANSSRKFLSLIQKLIGPNSDHFKKD